MVTQTTLPSYDEFSTWVSDVLKHLYDSAYLQTHPLANFLVNPATDPHHRSQELRRVMLEAIQILYPAGPASAQSPDWRNYKIMELRYIQGLTWTEVMDKLALGKTVYYRSHARALEAITEALWNGLQQKFEETSLPPEMGSHQTRAEEAQRNLDRLVAQADWQRIKAIPVLQKLQPVITSLAQAKAAALSIDLSHPLTILHADRVILRQTILNVVTYAMDFAAGGWVVIRSFAEGAEAGIDIQAQAGMERTAPLPGRARQGVGLEICEQFMREMGGILYLAAQEDSWQARLAWPTAVNPVLLVIDDNEGLVDLFRRYLAGSHWQIIGATGGAEARAVIAGTRPGVIVLDVLMPGEDGWELLIDFKANEAIQDIPVIICSVFNEPQLARNLGAAAYLPKPVTQQSLRQVLKPWHQAGATLDLAP